MASEGGIYIPPVLSKDKDELRSALKPGDPWTFLGTRAGVEKAGDLVTVWWSTAEPGRVFEVVKVHLSALETVYVGFQPEPGSQEAANVRQG